MAVVKKEEFMEALKNKIGDSTEDADLKLLEDFSDTYDDMFGRLNSSDSTNWKEKYEQNDKEWREKYRARFFDSGIEDPTVKQKHKEDEEERAEEITVDDLFSSEG